MNPSVLNSFLILLALGLITPFALDHAMERSHPIDHDRIEKWKDFPTTPSKQTEAGMVRGGSYKLSFTLMVDAAAENVVVWEMEQALREYWATFLHSLRRITTFEIDVQVLYFSKLAPTRSKEDSVTLEELKWFVGTNDWNANSLINDQQIMLHFMAYLPKSNKFKISGQEENFVIVPRWGGIVSLPMSTENRTFIGKEDLRHTLDIFKAQLCYFLKIKQTKDDSIEARDVESWKNDYIRNTISTLTSLDDLLESTSHMIVLKRVDDLVTESLDKLDAVVHAKDPLGMECLENARQASQLAERAFFDPSLLPQLYFPPEHWFAVFMPFLLPALLPIISGLLNIVRKRKQSQKGSK